jgi:phage-related protein
MRVRFYVTGSGRSPVGDFLMEQSDEVRVDLMDAVALLEGGKVPAMPKSRSLANIRPGLHELRLKDRRGQIRVIYFIKRDVAIYLLHAFLKKTRDLPRREIEVALKRLKEV